ncbi:MAG TPA: hypothetical protein VMR34_04660 [Candidatus Saccharimonadales bacterium]|nr:hypothetical protein [Candidatus Saccharimonadales bacterium]
MSSVKQKLSIRYALVLIVILMIVGVCLFWVKIYDNPTKVFYGMLERSLSTSSFSKEIVQPSSSQTKQYVTVETGSSNDAESVISVDLGPNSIVKTESIGTPTTDYARYTEVKTPQKNSKGQTANFSSVIGVWGKSSPAGDQVTDGQLFNESILTVVPMANLSIAQRQSLMHFITANDVYQIVGKPKKISTSGRPQITYNVNVNTRQFIEMIKQFGEDIGLNQLSSINAGSFSANVSEFHVTVDVISRQLVSDTQVGTSRRETFSGYGTQIPISLPTKSIPITQLESQLQTIQ